MDAKSDTARERYAKLWQRLLVNFEDVSPRAALLLEQFEQPFEQLFSPAAKPARLPFARGTARAQRRPLDEPVEYRAHAAPRESRADEPAQRATPAHRCGPRADELADRVARIAPAYGPVADLMRAAGCDSAFLASLHAPELEETLLDLGLTRTQRRRVVFELGRANEADRTPDGISADLYPPTPSP